MKLKRIYLEITNRCNLSCHFCLPHHRKPQDLSVEQFRSILPELKALSDYLFFHVKGEPLLHPALQQFLSLAGQYELQVNLTTNGTLLANHQDMLCASPALRQVNISMHSLTEQTPIQQARYLQDVLNYAKVASQHHYVNLRFWNQQQGHYDAFTLATLQQICNAFPESHLSPQQICAKGNATLAHHIFLSFDEQFQWPTLDAPCYGTEGSCYGLRQQCAILVDGTLVPCCLDGDGIINLGNVYETPLSTLLEQPRAKKMAEGLRNNQLCESLCQHCGYIHLNK